jgi:ATP-dependent DNA helicase RecQ
VILRRQAEKVRGASSSSTKKERRADPAAELSTDAQVRWQALRAWRTQAAREHSVPAYVIFHDATLAEIARNAPETIDDLRHIPGMGVRKLERFGDEIIDVVESA